MAERQVELQTQVEAGAAVQEVLKAQGPALLLIQAFLRPVVARATEEALRALRVAQV